MDNLSPNMQLAMKLSLLNTRVSKRIDNILSMHGISFKEFQLLLNLSSASAQTMRRIELAESIGLTASGVTRMLAPMVKIKLVEKELNPRDARVSLVKLSKAGNKIFKDALVTFGQAVDGLTEKLSKSEVQQLLKLIEKL